MLGTLVTAVRASRGAAIHTCAAMLQVVRRACFSEEVRASQVHTRLSGQTDDAMQAECSGDGALKPLGTAAMLGTVGRRRQFMQEVLSVRNWARVCAHSRLRGAQTRS